jgi:hypothetical protein
MYHKFFIPPSIHPSIHDHSGCFYILAIVNNSTVWARNPFPVYNPNENEITTSQMSAPPYSPNFFWAILVAFAFSLFVQGTWNQPKGVGAIRPPDPAFNQNTSHSSPFCSLAHNCGEQGSLRRGTIWAACRNLQGQAEVS